MKLDLLKESWLDIVFEGRNKLYGAYQLRKSNPKVTMIAFLIGAAIFSTALSTPKIMSLFGGKSVKDDTVIDEQIVIVDLTPPPVDEALPPPPPPPPPPPQQEQVKFVKPVVAKTEEITEEIAKIEDIIDKKLGEKDIEGDPDAPLSVDPPGDGPTDVVGTGETDEVFLNAVLSVKADFPGGLQKFYDYVGRNFRTPDVDGLKGRILVSFVVERDGSLSDIKVIRDIGYGTGKEAIRVLKNSPKWIPGEQNGRKVRAQYQLPITIQPAN
ncbi:MAG: energy transducer TonB [Flavobacteriaceae bacterium]|jgi:protein TonB|nr:energy transducer TonB [Flavobacteriaceae bacterium]